MPSLSRYLLYCRPRRLRAPAHLCAEHGETPPVMRPCGANCVRALDWEEMTQCSALADGRVYSVPSTASIWSLLHTSNEFITSTPTDSSINSCGHGSPSTGSLSTVFVELMNATKSLISMATEQQRVAQFSSAVVATVYCVSVPHLTALLVLLPWINSLWRPLGTGVRCSSMLVSKHFPTSSWIAVLPWCFQSGTRTGKAILACSNVK